MKRVVLYPNLLALAALSAACSGADDVFADRPRFTEAACPAAAAQAVVRFSCGTVSVAENRGDPHSRRLNLAVAIAHTPAADKAADAVMFLAGGPAPDLESQFALFSQPGAAAWLGRRDAIFFDYRSLGRSTPHLVCTPAAPDGSVDAGRCVAQLKAAGADLSAYTDAAIAADAHDIRVALELGAVNLWGVSYGTRIALLMAREQPDGVRSLTLDATYPPQARDDVRQVADNAQLIRQLAADCQAAAGCAAAYPGLMARFEAALPGLNLAPLWVDGQPWSGDALLGVVSAALTSRTTVPVAPRLMDQIARRSLTSLSALLGADPPAAQAAPADLGALPLAQLARCGADVLAADEPALLALAQDADALQAALARSLLRSRSECAPWPARAATLADKRAVVSAKPTLMINGAYDPLTPVAQAQRVKSGLTAATLVVFPGFGHAVLEDRDPNDSCPFDLVHAFLDRLDGSTLDLSCVRALAAPQWVLSPG